MTSPDFNTIATRIILSLTGRRWTWPPRRNVEEYWVPETVNQIMLVGRPVSAVYSVVDRADRAYDYELSDGFRLRIPELGGSTWPFFPYPAYDANGGVYPGAFRRRGTHLKVEYTFGSPPPPDVQLAIDELAREFGKIGCDDCKLPERVTSVSREGVNWTVLDPQQFLEGGKTGLYYPDLIISTYGRKVRARAKVYSPEYRPPRRLSSTVVQVL